MVCLGREDVYNSATRETLRLRLISKVGVGGLPPRMAEAEGCIYELIDIRGYVERCDVDGK